MRFVFFDDFRPGVEDDGLVFDVADQLDSGDRGLNGLVRSFIERKSQLRLVGGAPLASLRLRAPVPEPVHIVCAIVNYKGDGKEVKEADFFLKSPLAVIGPGDTIKLPPNDKVLVFQHEAELAVVIKSEAANVPASRAMDYVFGYTGMIDVSARGLGGYYKGKSYSTFAPMGPALVTADEITDPHNLRVRLWVNDTLRQDYSTADMAHRIDELIETASAITRLLPGDVIATGTHHRGLGPMQHGDRVKMEIEGIGSASFQVEDSLNRKWDPDAADGGRSGPIG